MCTTDNHALNIHMHPTTVPAFTAFKLVSIPAFFPQHEIGTDSHNILCTQKGLSETWAQIMLPLLVQTWQCMKAYLLWNYLWVSLFLYSAKYGRKSEQPLEKETKWARSTIRTLEKSKPIILTVPALLLDKHPPRHHNAYSRRSVPTLAVQTQSNPIRPSALGITILLTLSACTLCTPQVLEHP